ncbi:rhomboid family intramembrane serine protease [Flavobacterium sp. 140616W15]|uniref:rhomboid family intramembrane serine protease n=1 Tax=Flavobacterium sp. 140616W15 TaxID=2478552 RepID=UPI000F0C498F|nr:rhomboid family intramembrane serine protease [Flavobacterium sp. 140616W15]AYN03132.1 rhomboid family intramembrane serine protease [Flavobacterium sp. 140616W15]
MAFGLPASYHQYTPLITNLSRSQFIAIAIKISKKLNWILVEVSENQLIARTTNTKNTWDENIFVGFKDDAIYINSSSNGNQPYDRGKNKRNVEAFLDLFYEIIIEKSNQDLEEISPEEYIKIEQTNISQEEVHHASITHFYSILSIFIPVKNYFITPILINLNILIFLIMCFSGTNMFLPETHDIIDWGANFGPLTTENDWWRLLTSCFIHLGIFHLLSNCVALAYAGLLLESYLKKWGTIVTYLFSGIIASLASLYWNVDMVSAGASGAVFGMYGILLVTVLSGVLNNKIKPHVLLIIGLLLISNFFGSSKIVDDAAHVGGFCAGILFGIILTITNKKKQIGLICISSIATVIIIVSFIYLKKSKTYIYEIIEYETGMQEFTNMEKMALEAYGIYNKNDKDELLYMIKDRGIYYWNENIVLVKKLDKLYLPERIHIQNKNIITYCELRVKMYELGYNKINGNTNKYDNEMAKLDAQIKEIGDIIKKQIKNKN